MARYKHSDLGLAASHWSNSPDCRHAGSLSTVVFVHRLYVPCHRPTGSRALYVAPVLLRQHRQAHEWGHSHLPLPGLSGYLARDERAKGGS